MKRIIICLKTLTALLHLAAKGDIRYYLNGVHVEPVGNDEIRYAATNGYLYGIRQVKTLPAVGSIVGADSSDGIAPLIIPREILEHIKLDRTHSQGFLTVHDAAQNEDGTKKPRECALEYQGLTLTFRELEGRFPSFRGVTPVMFSGEAAQFAPSLLAMIEKAGRQIIGNKASDFPQSAPVIAHNGSGIAAFMVADAELYGSIAPYKADDFSLPEWLVEAAAQGVIECCEKELADAKMADWRQDAIPEIEARLIDARTALSTGRVVLQG